jgi:Domain of unknown function DUF29
VKSDRHAIIHHRRGDDDSVATRVITQGTVELDPPGLTPGVRSSLRLRCRGSRLRGLAAGAILGGRRPLPMAKALDQPSLYDQDYVAWLDEQVRHLRSGRLAALDVEHVAQELEGLMSSERRELENRLEALIHHLLKWDHQPDQRSNRWRATVQEQRTRIRRLLRFSPSLKRELAPMAEDVYPDAVRAAAIETRMSESAFPAKLSYPVDQIFERDLPAEELPAKRSTRKKHP